MNNQLNNPMKTKGFAFVEFCTQNPEKLKNDFKKLGFQEVAQHKEQEIYLFRQGQINFIINMSSEYAVKFAQAHGDSACAMGFQVEQAQFAYGRALELKAEAANTTKPYSAPAIFGIGRSLLYLVDHDIFESDFRFYSGVDSHPKGCGLIEIDHLTHNVKKGQMSVWADYYERLFNFREIRFFDIKGKLTGLYSRALTSPCGKIRIPLNESADDQSQIAEFIEQFKGEGIQHIALSSENIYHSVPALKQSQIEFLDTPDTYYEMLNDRIPWNQENISALQKDCILMDGGKDPEQGLLLQIFTQNMLGPVFFEIIQRKGNDGFGEGNFQALFDAIERDQIKRGVLT